MSEKKKIGFCVCGSFCTHEKTLKTLRSLCEKYEVLPIISANVKKTNTRFGNSDDFYRAVEEITESAVISTVRDAEPLGPEIKLDMLVICPCTGNTLAKLSHGITDTAVTMAAKATLRSNRPVVIALATNDALGANFANIALLFNRKNIFFVPLHQDDCELKPYSLVCDFSRLEETMTAAFAAKQLMPLFY